MMNCATTGLEQHSLLYQVTHELETEAVSQNKPFFLQVDFLTGILSY
jgi:hypothetical protein